MCALSYGYLCVSVLKEETVQHKDSPAKRALCVSYDCCLIPPAATVTAASSWRRDISPPAPVFFSPLICLTLLLFLSSPWAIYYCTPLSIWSSVATAGVCVYVPETRIKLLFIVFEQEIISNVSPHSLFSPLLFITLL